jgi:hypothetical protein
MMMNIIDDRMQDREQAEGARRAIRADEGWDCGC